MTANPMCSCMSENPRPEVAVIVLAPPQDAPMSADMEPISSSIWR